MGIEIIWSKSIFLVILLLFVGAAIFFVAIADEMKKVSFRTLFLLITFSLLLFTSFVMGSFAGNGFLPRKTCALSSFLKNGKAYDIYAEKPVGNKYILLIGEHDVNGAVYAFRINKDALPPEHFTMIDGKPFGLLLPH